MACLGECDQQWPEEPKDTIGSPGLDARIIGFETGL